VDIVVQLRSDMASMLARANSSVAESAPSNPALQPIAQTLAAFDADLVPQHPGTDDPQLQTWFVVPCGERDARACEALALALRRHDAVLSAYLKPDPTPAAYPGAG
jgi:hypothetical protein